MRFWPLKKVLVEKYEFSEQDAKDLSDFLVPILDFVPEKRPTAAQCLLHSWINAGPRLLELSLPDAQSKAVDALNSDQTKKQNEEEREVMEVGIGKIAISKNIKNFRSYSVKF